MLEFFLHSFLGIALFFIINWIGKHSYSIGYQEISIIEKTEEAPALNFLIRVLSPIVYIIIISSILYYFHQDRFVKNIYLVNVYYIIFRLFFNLVTNRGLLLNWYRLALYWMAIVIISYFTYMKLISQKANILPDFTGIANELWIIILVFLFQTANNIRLSNDGAFKRKKHFIESQYLYFREKYSAIIKTVIENEALERLVYSIIIYEDFNRPKLARLIENLKFKFTNKPHTLGVMQVYTVKFVDDKQSVISGTTKILSAYNKISQGADKPIDANTLYFIISDYNKGQSYYEEIMSIFNQIGNSIV